MRGSDFLDKMEHIAPEYIEEAEEKPKSGKKPWIKWLAAAACICVIAGILLPMDFYEAPQEPSGEMPEVIHDGNSFLISPYPGSIFEKLPEGFVYAGKTDTGSGFEDCSYFANPDIPEWIYVYHEVMTDGTLDEYGVMNRTEPHDAYVRYVDERLRGADLVCVDGEYYISIWSAKPYGDNPDVTWEYLDEMEAKYGIRIEGEPPEGFVLLGITEFSGYDTVPRGTLVSNEGEFEVYINPDNPEMIYVSTFWYTKTKEEKIQTKHEGFNVYIKYDCPFA